MKDRKRVRGASHAQRGTRQPENVSSDQAFSVKRRKHSVSAPNSKKKFDPSKKEGASLKPRNEETVSLPKKVRKDSKVIDLCGNILKNYPTFESKRRFIAKVSQSILASPEEELKSLCILFSIFDQTKLFLGKNNEIESVQLPSETLLKKNDSLEIKEKSTLCSLSLVSICAVLTDLLPSYNLSANDESMSSIHLSKAASKIRCYEKLLVEYVSNLIAILKHHVRKIPTIIVPLLCELLKNASNSEFGDELIKLCVQNATLHRRNGQKNFSKPSGEVAGDTTALHVSELCCSSLENIISQDPTLNTATKVVQAIGTLEKKKAKPGKSRLGHLSGRLLDVVSNLDSKFNQLHIAQDTMLPNQHGKIDRKLLKDLRTSSINDSKENIAKNRRAIFTELFIIYTRILSSIGSYSEDVIGSCLTGVNNLRCHINPELLSEIMNKIRHFLLETDHISPSIGLTAIETAIALLQTTKSMALTDPSWINRAFCGILRSSLARMPCNYSLSKTSDSASLPTSHVKSPQLHNNSSERLNYFYSAISQQHGEQLDTNSFRLFCDCGFALQCLKLLEKLVQRGDIFGDRCNTQNLEGLVEMIQNLLLLALHSDPFVSIAFYLQIRRIITLYPKLKSLMNPDGIVFSSLCDSRTLFWTLEVLGNHVSPFVRQQYFSLMSLASDDLVRQRFVAKKTELGAIANITRNGFISEPSTMICGQKSQFSKCFNVGIIGLPFDQLACLDINGLCKQSSQLASSSVFSHCFHDIMEEKSMRTMLCNLSFAGKVFVPSENKIRSIVNKLV
ncbi:hypothetical protein IE077_003145 [Cardiosporidium cionae]|uniref:Nucleolar complex-associated protein 3 N-terminal domain-containing protein n=1 Tax=Cardiosporidium cionae TaxID=476202 RepID=A0ABQ7JF81_9APIC|nr:hypothetical protein IE077_003145 [Cardiosporidium cionae]|eukprot:KAF8822676.1 hypothetical protein IE077_003145 [Cardiosporidium cionae]